MKTTFIILACLVFLAASAWAEEDETEIAERSQLPGLTDNEQNCVDAKVRADKTILNNIFDCIRSDPTAAKRLSCIKKLSPLKACFRMYKRTFSPFH
jgi:hypothetical protein